MKSKNTRAADIFIDIEAHIESGRFIRDNSLNPQDIREFTFSPADLHNCRKILDLGCSYGFFIHGLAGRLHPEAHINGVDLWEGCEDYYIKACLDSGYTGEFCLSGDAFCKKYPDRYFDLVLCSYALYFFPEVIPEIARILRPNGFFITVTHAVPHMQELNAVIKKLLARHTGCPQQDLPLEKLLRGFSGANGMRLLAPWFGKINDYQYVNALRINKVNLPALIKYLCFKLPLFFPDDCGIDCSFIKSVVADYLNDLLTKQEFFQISKNDTVYICRRPNQNYRKKI